MRRVHLAVNNIHRVLLTLLAVFGEIIITNSSQSRYDTMDVADSKVDSPHTFDRVVVGKRMTT